MIPVTSCAGKSLAVFGLGRSGIATCRALLAGGATVIAWDDDPKARQVASAECPVVDLHSTDWSRLSGLVLAPGVPLTHPVPHWTVQRARAAGVEIIGDVELFARERQLVCPAADFVAITGTNGKSTTTALVAHVLARANRDVQMGGNIGVPILELDALNRNRAYVIELSSYQIDLMPTLHPTVGVLLNISPDHIERHGTFAQYARIKGRVLERAQTRVVGVDDSASLTVYQCWIQAEDERTIGISGGPLTEGIGIRGTEVCAHSATEHRSLADIAGVPSLRGTHNGQNAAAAAAVATALGIAPSILAEGLRSFPGLPHRMEEVGRCGKVLFINDSKATNAESASHALASFDQEIYWIAGGLSKAGGITKLQPLFQRIAKAYLIGEAATEFSETLRGQADFVLCETLKDAVSLASADAKEARGSRPVVLFSPACASFDQFRSFEARGDAFRRQVMALDGVAVTVRQS
ncbi:MAG: UDP-N-acetylmuramoyl-L-alanine--D-glutamate ligase [Hyphomicrobiaceae bacterium]